MTITSLSTIKNGGVMEGIATVDVIIEALAQYVQLLRDKNLPMTTKCNQFQPILQEESEKKWRLSDFLKF